MTITFKRARLEMCFTQQPAERSLLLVDQGLDDAECSRIPIAIKMAQNLGLGVVAEGVENEQQFNILTEYGCQLFQGYLLSRPVDASSFIGLLKQQD